QKEQSKCRQGTGQSICNNHFKIKCHFLNFSNFLPGSGARMFRRHRDRNTEAECRHKLEEMAGDAAGDTSRKSEGQGKRCRESLCNAAW
ncbi:unnamed protein product, partial [Staurois parvus]